MFIIAGTNPPILGDQARVVEWSLKTYIWQLPKHKKNHSKLLHIKSMYS